MCYDKGKNGKESYNHGKMDKKLLGLAAIGSAAAGLVYYFKKSKKDIDKFANSVPKEIRTSYG